MIWFWYLVFYSFVGFLLEVVFAHFAGVDPHRKCFLILPLCPVYGFGACTIVWAAAEAPNALAIFLIGALAATAWEYLIAAFYEDVLGASFWNYSDLPLNLHGRVCLPFSIAWGLLSLPLVYWLHPLIAGLDFSPPFFVTVLMAAAVCMDGVLSCAVVMCSGTRDSLNWSVRRV